MDIGGLHAKSSKINTAFKSDHIDICQTVLYSDHIIVIYHSGPL